MNLKTKFTLIIASAVITIFILTAFSVFLHYEKSIKETVAQQQFLMISMLAGELDNKIVTARQLLIAAAKTIPPNIMRNPAKAQAFLDGKYGMHTLCDNSLYLFTPSGKLFVDSPDTGRMGSDFSFREYMINTIKTKKPYISDPYVSSKSHKHPVIMLTVPFFDRKGEIEGIFSGGIDLMGDNFLGKISTVTIGKTGYLCLAAADGTIIMHPDKKRIMIKHAPGLNRLYVKALRGFEGTDETTTSAGVKMVASFKQLKAKNWILIADYPSVEAYRPIQQAKQYFLIATIAVIGAVFLIISSIIKSLLNPLELFTSHIEALPQKTGDTRYITINTEDEIGTLSGAFNKMVTENDSKSMALQRSEELYRTVTEFSSDLVFWIDTDNKVIFVSQNCEKFCGYTQEEFYSSPELLKTIIHPDDRTLWVEHNSDSNGHNVYEQLEVRMVTKSGQVCWISHNCLPVYDKEGIYEGRRGSYRNITERKKAEETLRESEARFRALIEKAPIAISISRGGRTIYVNRKFLTLYGFQSVDELVGQPIFDHWAAESREIIRERSQKRERGEPVPSEYEGTGQRKDGSRFLVHIVVETVELPDGPAFMAFLSDITERKQIEEQFLHSQKMESIGLLAGGIAHNINNILGAIMGFTTLLQMQIKKDNPARENLDHLPALTARAATLVKDLMAFSRKQVLDMKPTSLSKIVSMTWKVLSKIIGEDIKLNTQLSDKDIVINADGLQIEQALINLATNARDAMPDGGRLTISTESFEIDDNFINMHGYGKLGRYALLTVEDTGMGIDEQSKEKIFEPFFTTKGVGKGTGLGLAMVYGTIKGHNGYINVYSEVGKGATFRIYLPEIDTGAAETMKLDDSPLRGGIETILLVEDESSLRYVTRSMLEKFGYKIMEAEDGKNAVNKFSEHKHEINLVIMDVIMPKKNGKEAYREMQKLKPDVKVIFTSGHAGDLLTRKKIVEEGFNFISKPVSTRELLEKIRDVLDKRET